MLRVKHRFDGRRWDTEDIFQALSQYFGIMTVREQLGVIPMRYPRSWRIRAFIAGYRHEYTAHPWGMGYGPDWKYRIKNEIVEHQELGRLPYYLLRIGTAQIRQAEMIEWALIRTQALK
ncbi:MAG: hypothetical protein UY70_C0022G0007 [Candidatus Kaiserbacteria bacterium GW2011_GWB1_52_6]|uniref:Uncharacterized protein n=2 Tax=Candidatus Kaiseribacteriota TaxID=1752734 RepID=A0A0G1X5V2_9BACT|nr:MAG: hypothetical protein UY67_C0002G0035 [Candidatus Kaiserbacteria bacterium GW2011_GWA2_52_12]KKW26528.1 MAG: hypothetical protein UY70_C0022G0007 [Candidatus Kaiserbacteria bacterium GW2011_GWB1_52_6]